MALLSSMRAQVRQLRQPKEFRIHAAAWPGDTLAAFERLVTDLPGKQRLVTDLPGTPGPVSDEALPGPSVAEVVTSIWRLDRRARKLPGDNRVMTRYLEMAWDSLTQAGVRVQEHLNDPFDAGLALEVTSYQPAPGLDRDRVVETIRPSIYLNDQVIQRGEVIVGTPDPVAKEATP
ncbi:hypothetical protein AB0I81_02500 [Nonomuraea sp. NPDC050404]|uniref:hypothetical protein n=1 Tax=Nonomuraea sp. NPDC050404 TaxID=3155783 RepID=UPI0033E4AB61